LDIGYWILAGLGCFILLAGCGVGPAAGAPVSAEPPTVSSFFGPVGTTSPPAEAEAGAGPPTIAPYFRLETTTPWPTRTHPPLPTSGPTRTPAPESAVADTPSPSPAGTEAAAYLEAAIYDDELAPGWSLEYSQGMDYDLADSSHVYSGTVSVAVTPAQEYGSLFFSVGADAAKAYPYERVLGARFWLNSGALEIAPADLAVTIVGSNAYAYYTPDDDSVDLNADSFFSETRLYYLDVNRSIPPETWVEIVVWLDELPFDPNYTYITGVYLKNDEGFTQTFYVDDVALLLTPEGG